MKKLVLLMVLILTLSCEKELADIGVLGENSSIVGTWIDDGFDEDLIILKRTDSFDSSKYGFTINDDGSFIERKNSGWCGTPPISYDNFEGNWEAVSDSLLSITVGYWGGTMTYQIRIVSLDQESLYIKYLYAEDRVQANIAPH